MKPTQIDSGRLISLSPLGETDIERVRTWRNSDEVRNCMIWRGEITPKAQKDWFRMVSNNTQTAYYMIKLLDGEIPGGLVEIKKVDKNNQHEEWGIFLGETSLRGKGIAAEAACLFLHHAFSEWNIHKIKATLIAENTSSIRFHQSIGFAKEGLLREEVYIGGYYKDVILCGLLSSEFYQKNRVKKVLQTARRSLAKQ